MSTATRRSPGLSPRASLKSLVTTTTYAAEDTADILVCSDCASGLRWAVRWVAAGAAHAAPVADRQSALVVAGWLAIHGGAVDVEIHVPTGAP